MSDCWPLGNVGNFSLNLREKKDTFSKIRLYEYDFTKHEPTSPLFTNIASLLYSWRYYVAKDFRERDELPVRRNTELILNWVGDAG